jgi:hypothetical protein
LSGAVDSLQWHYDYLTRRARSRVLNGTARLFDARACAFYDDVMARGFFPNVYIDVLPEYRLLYVWIPKCATSLIKTILILLSGREPGPYQDLHKRKVSGLEGPRHVGISAFYRVATDPSALRFAFVRNPYDRLVSAWADKFQDKPLVRGNSFIEQYLDLRAEIDPALPEGADHTLSFADFVIYATETAHRAVDPHWHVQDDFLTVPGVTLNFIGKLESFNADFVRVLDHVNASDDLRKKAIIPVNSSRRARCTDYYSDDLARRVHTAYERDFDRFGYAVAVPD